MTIANIMSPVVAQITPDLPLASAAKMMEDKHISSLLVVENGQPVGILTESDLVRGIANDVATSLPVSALMSAPLRSVALTTNKVDAYHTLIKHGIRHLLVVDPDGHAAGMVSKTDLLQDIIQTQAGKLDQLQTDLLNTRSDTAVAAWKRPLSDLLDNLPFKIYVKDTQSNYISCNKSYADDLGIQPSEIVNQTDFHFHPADLAQRYRDDDATVIAEGKLIEVTRSYRVEEHELWIHTSKAPWRDALGNIGGVIGISRDITQEYQLNKALQRKTRLYAVLSQGNSAITHIQDTQQLLDKICEVVLNFGGFRLAWVGREISGNKVLPVAVAGAARDYVMELNITTRADLAEGQGPTGTAIRENRVVIVNDFIADTMTTLWHEAAMRHELRGSISLPIMAHDFRGALTVYADSVNFFDDEVIGLLQELSKDLSFALEQIHANAVKQQQESELNLAAQVFASSADAMMITDANNNTIRVNQAFCDITGYERDEIIGKNPRILKSEKHDRDFYLTMWRSLSAQGSWQGEIWNRRKNGEIFPEWTSISTIKDSSGKVTHFVAVFSDLIQKKVLAELDHLKHFDPLTDLPNRFFLEDRIENAIIHAKQHSRFIGVIFLNLDHFHTVNDMFGHSGGDRMLVVTAQRLIGVVPAHATVTRLSADTFVIGLPDLNTSEEINRIAELITQRIYEPFSIEDQQVQLSARMGIAVYPMDGDDAATLMKCADAALADAKQTSGRNSFRFYSACMNEQARKLVIMSSELRNAITQNRLVLHYQPQIDIITGDIIGAEALIRIINAEYGLIPPGEFISIAEETGLIVPMGEWAIREACRQMQQWHTDGYPELIIAVNLSPMQLHQANLTDVIKNALQESGLAAQYLELEFTESAIIRNVKETIAIMQQFKAMGLHLSIDDFGTGYSSLSYLKQFPVDKLKIDQSFVSNITQNPNDAAIVQAIIALARTLGMTTIAEGVETEAQLGYLRSVHCNEMQGYLYSPPLPATEFAALMGRGKTLAANKSEKILLLVDDEENVRMSLKRVLRREGYSILEASSAEEGLELMAQNQVMVVLSDQRMPGMTGVEFLRRIKTMYPDTVRMILSGYTEVSTLTNAINQGEIYQFISKPWENEALIAQLREAFVRYDSLKSSNS